MRDERPRGELQQRPIQPVAVTNVSTPQRPVRIRTDSVDRAPPKITTEDPDGHTINAPSLKSKPQPPPRTLSPVSTSNMNTLNGWAMSSSSKKGPSNSNSAKTKGNSSIAPTIRTVPSEAEPEDRPVASLEKIKKLHAHKEANGLAAGMPHSIRSESSSTLDTTNTPTKSGTSTPVARHSDSPSARLSESYGPTISSSSYTSLFSGNPSNNNLAVQNGNSIQRRVSTEFGPTVSYTHTSNINTSNSNTLHPPEDAGGGTQWNSAVGRASLGKSGRVIERLMGENDMLKRDLNIERLRAEENKEAVKMAEGRMDALHAEHDQKLHDAKIVKTLLVRRERQLSDLKEQVESERARADEAIEREGVWKAEMERGQEEAKRKVEEALDRAAMMEGRNNAMTSHWRDRKAEISRATEEMNVTIARMVKERAKDDEKIQELHSVCERGEEERRKLQRENEEIRRQFEAYKKVQEGSLVGIKSRARELEEENERVLAESKRVLGELKWAMAVKRDLRDEK